MEYLTMMVTFVPLILGGETVRNWLDSEFCPSCGLGKSCCDIVDHSVGYHFHFTKIIV